MNIIDKYIGKYLLTYDNSRLIRSFWLDEIIKSYRYRHGWKIETANGYFIKCDIDNFYTNEDFIYDTVDEETLDIDTNFIFQYHPKFISAKEAQRIKDRIKKYGKKETYTYD